MRSLFLSIVLFLILCTASHAANDPFFMKLATQYENVKIERVITSDLIILDNGKKVHLIGIKSFDQPRKFREVPRDENGFVIEETPDPTTSVEERASDFVQDLLFNKKVKVEFDSLSSDENGYAWGYVFLADGTFANAEILRQGYAQLQIQPPNTKYAERLRDAYREARQEKRGIHAE
jgi:micrococcal nuclease